MIDWGVTNFFMCVLTKEFKRGNKVCFLPLCVNAMAYEEATILKVTYGGKLLYLRIWRNHSARFAHIIVTACFTGR